MTKLYDKMFSDIIILVKMTKEIPAHSHGLIAYTLANITRTVCTYGAARAITCYHVIVPRENFTLRPSWRKK